MNVALVVKPSPSTQMRDDRNMGYWSYPVDQYQWDHFVFAEKYTYGNKMNGYDIIFQEDSGPYQIKGLKKPLVYLAIDSTLSAAHLQSRLERAQHADLILVDQDDPEHFTGFGIPVRRWNYCVNDHLMRDYGEERIIDVSFHCGGNGLENRRQVRGMLHTYCKKRGLVYKSGILHITEYARAMAKSKIVVNWPRVSANRPHRVFDAMACGACLVSGPFPEIPGDNLVEGRDYVRADTIADVPDIIDDLLESGRWQEVAKNGKKRVSKYHTWEMRAEQLKEIIGKELGK